MKYIMSILVYVMTSHTLSAQNDSSRVVIDYKYVGILANGNFYTDSFRVEPGASVRVGGGISYYPHKTVRIQSWGFADYNGKTLTKNIMLGVLYTPVTGFTVAAGHVPTLSAGMRPLPPTSLGQFEPWTPAQLPGLAPGVTVRYAFQKSDIGIGGCYRLKHPEVHGRIKIRSILAVGYYNQSGKWGASVGVLRDKFSIKAIVTDSLYGFLSVVTLLGKEKLFAYLDAGASREKLVRAEIGVFKSFEKKPFGGLVGIGYSYEIQAIKTYFFFHLQ